MSNVHIFLIQISTRLFSITAAPSKPEKVKVTKTDKDTATLEWSKPSSDGGSRIRRYIIYKRIEMTDKWVKVTTVEQFLTQTNVDKLKYEKNYFFAVSAENDIGESDKGETTQPMKLEKPSGEYFSYFYNYHPLFHTFT